MNPLYDSMVRTYQEVFEELYILEVPGTTNRIMLALPRKQALDHAQLVRLARKTATDKRFDFDMGAFQPEQFSHASRKSRTGQVLRDAEQVQPARALSR